MRNLLAAACAAIALTGCSSAAAATPTPVPTPTPTLMRCVGQVTDTNGHHAGFAINYATSNAAASAITLTPNNITLTATHPSASVKISDPGYTGKFAVAFANCTVYLNAKFMNRTTLVVSI
jgi:hypothetical protein